MNDSALPEPSAHIEINPNLHTEPCLNCNQALQGNYCSNCGQPRDTVIKSFWHLIVDYFENSFNYDSRLVRTLPLLLFQPGKLTTEYLTGHRARYVPPLRMYLIISLLFFLTISMDDSPQANVDPNNNQTISTDLPNMKASEASLKERIIESMEDSKTQSSENFADQINKIAPNDFDVNFTFLSEQKNIEIKNNLLRKTSMIIWKFKHDQNALKRDFISLLSKMMFIMLPVFALLLKLIYLSSNRLYMEHLIQVIHTHCFVYIALIILPLPDYLVANHVNDFSFGKSLFTNLLSWLETLLSLYIIFYVYKVIRKVYQQSRTKSVVKYILSINGYFFLLLLVLPLMLILQLI